MFRLLRGMFALAIWDAPRRTLGPGPRPAGPEAPGLSPRRRGRSIFASELKALLALPEADVPRRIDPLALDHYLSYGYVPHPRTILEGTSQAAAGALRRLARRRADDRALLGRPTGTPSANGPSRRTSRSCARPSATPCASR